MNYNTQPDDNPQILVRLSHYGALLFSELAIQHFRLASATKCCVYYDRSRHRIGIELLPDDLDALPYGGSKPIKSTRIVHTSRCSAQIMICSLVRHYGIKIARNTVCPAVTEQFGDISLISVDLTPTIAAAGQKKVTLAESGITQRHIITL